MINVGVGILLSLIYLLNANRTPLATPLANPTGLSCLRAYSHIPEFKVISKFHRTNEWNWLLLLLLTRCCHGGIKTSAIFLLLRLKNAVLLVLLLRKN